MANKNPFASITKTGPGLLTIAKKTKEFEKYAVYVGIPQDNNLRKEKDKLGVSSEAGSITNAQLLWLHTKGSPVNNIPARPVLQPAIEKNQEKISQRYVKAFKEFIQGDKDKAIQSLEKIGMFAQNIARRYFVEDNGWAPNKPATIKAKGSDKPLIDTGEMRKSITYVLETPSERKIGDKSK